MNYLVIKRDGINRDGIGSCEVLQRSRQETLWEEEAAYPENLKEIEEEYLKSECQRGLILSFLLNKHI